MSGRKVPSFRKVITKTGVYTMGLLCLTQPLLNVSAHAYAMTDDAQSHSNAYISESGLYNEATLLNKATRNKENQSLQNNNVNHQYTATPSSTKESYNRIGKSNSVPVTNVQAPTINKKDSEQLKSETQKEDEHASSSNNASLEEAQSEDSQQNGNNGANEDPAPIKPENHTQPSDQGQASPQGGETPPKDETGDSSQDGNSPSKPDHDRQIKMISRQTQTNNHLSMTISRQIQTNNRLNMTINHQIRINNHLGMMISHQRQINSLTKVKSLNQNLIRQSQKIVTRKVEMEEHQQVIRTIHHIKMDRRNPTRMVSFRIQTFHITNLMGQLIILYLKIKQVTINQTMISINVIQN